MKRISIGRQIFNIVRNLAQSSKVNINQSTKLQGENGEGKRWWISLHSHLIQIPCKSCKGNSVPWAEPTRLDLFLFFCQFPIIMRMIIPTFHLQFPSLNPHFFFTFDLQANPHNNFSPLSCGPLHSLLHLPSQLLATSWPSQVW